MTQLFLIFRSTPKTVEMKKHLLLALTLIFSASLSRSQCSPTVNSASEAINGFQQRTNSNKYYWVCKGGSLNLTGSNNTVYAEDSATVVSAGDSNIVYQKMYGTVDVSGNFNEVYYANTTTFTDNGANTTKQKCLSGMNFDYSQAPTSGCDIYAGVEKMVEENTFNIYPVPASSYLYIQSSQSDLSVISIYSMDGKKLRLVRPSGTLTKLDVQDLLPGMYLVEWKNANGRSVQKFSIE